MTKKGPILEQTIAKIGYLLFFFIVFPLLLFFSACGTAPVKGSSGGVTSGFRYPTEVEQELDYWCNKIFDPNYAHLLGPSRTSAPSHIIAVGAEILAGFKDGREVSLPISTNLPQGETLYCGLRNQHYDCLPGGVNWDNRCKKTR